MNIIIFGPQGSGKGTQAEMIAKKFGLKQLETGRTLRQISLENTPLGLEVAKVMKEGRLVPDETMYKLIESALTPGVIMDGFPRTLAQVHWLESKINIDKVIFLKISRQEALRRLTARMICPKCNRIYNLLTLPPKNGEICDVDQTRLTRRADETSEAINKRLDEYEKNAQPVLDYYRVAGKLVEIDGERSIETIFEDIESKLRDENTNKIT